MTTEQFAWVITNRGSGYHGYGSCCCPAFVGVFSSFDAGVAWLESRANGQKVTVYRFDEEAHNYAGVRDFELELVRVDEPL